jgi:hypothetical protein
MSAEIVDSIARFSLYASFWGPLAVFVASVTFLRKGSAVRSLAVSILLAASTFVFFTGVWFSFFFRDGLGPEMIASEGWEAVVRASGPMVLGIFLAVILGVSALWAVKVAPSRPERPST